MSAARKTVLLVEDDPADVEFLQLALVSAGERAQLCIASSGREAMQQFTGDREGERPVLVLLDLNLPLVRGDEILGFLKRDPELRHIPVVMLTSSCAEIDRELCTGLGCSAYLVKPDDLRGYRDLAKVIVRILDGTRE